MYFLLLNIDFLYVERMIEHWGNEFNYCHAMVLKSTKKPTKIQEEIAASILQLIGFKLDLSWNAFQVSGYICLIII